jgi:hypothetical protein
MIPGPGDLNRRTSWTEADWLAHLEEHLRTLEKLVIWGEMYGFRNAGYEEEVRSAFAETKSEVTRVREELETRRLTGGR